VEDIDRTFDRLKHRLDFDALLEKMKNKNAVVYPVAHHETFRMTFNGYITKISDALEEAGWTWLEFDEEFDKRFNK
jgi:hypothetical protein